MDETDPPVAASPTKNSEDDTIEDLLKSGAKVVAVNHLHNHGNDIREITRLAEVNPRLAEKVIDNKEKREKREESSFRLGLLYTLIMLCVLILGVVYVVVHAGLWALIGMIGTVLATALLVRVVITGEWSETSWVGKIVSALVSAAGGRVAADDSEKPDDQSKA